MSKKNSRFEIKNESGVAQIKIVGRISNWANNSESFTQTVDSLLAMGVTKASLYLNTVGGTMDEAFEIGNQLRRFESVDCVLGSIVASSGSFLLNYCTNVTASKNTAVMIHMPSAMAMLNSPEDADSAKQQYLVYLNRLLDDLAERTGQTKEQLEKWCRATTWMNATLAKERGFVDSISGEDDKVVPDGVKAMLKEFKNTPLNLLNSLVEEDEEEDEGVQNNNQILMNKEFLKKLGLPENATEADVLAKFESLQKTANEVSALKLHNLVALGAKKGLPENVVKSIHAGSGEGSEAIINSMPDVMPEATPEALGNPAHTHALNPITDRIHNHLQNNGGNAGKPEGPKNFVELEKQGEAAVRNFAKNNPKAYAALFNEGKAENYHLTEDDVKNSFQ